jgi:DNA polymerase-1
MLILKRYGIETNPVEDTMLLSYALSAGAHGHGMDELAELHLQHDTIKFNDVTGTGKSRISFAEVELEKARDYAAEDADITLRLWKTLKPQVAAERLLSVYEEIDRPLIPVLAAMEKRGVRVDVSNLRDLSRDFAKRMALLEAEIHKLAGRDFNVGSPKQLGEVLFDELKLPGGRKSKTGAYYTDSYVLEDLEAEGHAVATKVLEWRGLSKLKGTYTDALAEHINPETGRVHTSFGMAIASTGRLSSTDPNLQNIPIRTEDGKKIRRAFIAAPGFKLISADYSQIELRLLAHVADVKTLKEAFKNGQDIHAITASQVFGVPVNEVNADHRRGAKTINFGLIYGMSAHGLASRLGIGRGEAGAMIERYFAQYPGIRDYMESMKEVARRQGYVETLYGRRCHLPMIHDKNGARRQFAERAAINAPLQGTAADIIKKAMVRIEKVLSSPSPLVGEGWDGGYAAASHPHPSLPPSRGKELECQMLLQVHDELVFEVKQGYEEQALKIIKPAMENAGELEVPLTVEAGVGDNWGEIH